MNEGLYALTLSKRSDSPFSREIGAIHAALVVVFPIASLLKLCVEGFGGAAYLISPVYRRIGIADLIAVVFALLLAWIALDRRRDAILARYGRLIRSKAANLPRVVEATHIFLFLGFAFLYVRNPWYCLVAFAVISIACAIALRSWQSRAPRMGR